MILATAKFAIAAEKKDREWNVLSIAVARERESSYLASLVVVILI